MKMKNILYFFLCSKYMNLVHLTNSALLFIGCDRSFVNNYLSLQIVSLESYAIKGFIIRIIEIKL